MILDRPWPSLRRESSECRCLRPTQSLRYPVQEAEDGVPRPLISCSKMTTLCFQHLIWDLTRITPARTFLPKERYVKGCWKLHWEGVILIRKYHYEMCNIMGKGRFWARQSARRDKSTNDEPHCPCYFTVGNRQASNAGPQQQESQKIRASLFWKQRKGMKTTYKEKYTVYT